MIFSNAVVLALGVFRIWVAHGVARLAVEKAKRSDPPPADPSALVTGLITGLAAYCLLALLEVGVRSIDGSDVYLSTFALWRAALGLGFLASGLIAATVGWRNFGPVKGVLLVLATLACRQFLSDVNRGFDFASTSYVERTTSRRRSFETYYRGSVRTDWLEFDGSQDVFDTPLPVRMRVESALRGAGALGLEISPGFLGWPWYRSIENVFDAQVRRSPRGGQGLAAPDVATLKLECLDGGRRSSCEVLMNRASEFHLTDDDLTRAEKKACAGGFYVACDRAKARARSVADQKAREDREAQQKLWHEIQRDPVRRQAKLNERLAREKIENKKSWLDKQEAADVLGVSRDWIEERIRFHEIEYEVADNGYRLSLEKVELLGRNHPERPSRKK